MNPIGVAAGVKNVGDEPMLVELTKLKRNESASVPDKKIPTRQPCGWAGKTSSLVWSVEPCS